jgi:hypothetical protein
LVITILSSTRETLEEGHGAAAGASGALASGGGSNEAAAAATFIRLGEFRATTRARAALRDAAQTSVHTVTTSPALSGSCGRPPQIAAFIAADPDDADAVCSDGDVYTLHFDRATDQPPASSRVEIDRLLAFSQAIGREYHGRWADASTLSITVVRGQAPAPELGIATASLRGPTVTGATLLRNANQRSRPSASISPSLQGSCGAPPTAERLEPSAGPRRAWDHAIAARLAG